MLRKCCFVLLSIFLNAYGATPQCVGASMILVAALSLQLQYQPFLDDDHNRLESIGLHACLLQLLVALMCNAVGKVGPSTLGPVSTLVLIFTMFGSSVGFFGRTVRVTIQSSKEAEGAMGKVARFCGRWCGEKRKGREKRQIVPAGNYRQPLSRPKVNNVTRQLSKSVHKAVVHNKANKVMQHAADHIHKHREKVQRRLKNSSSRLQKRLSERKMKSATAAAPNGNSSPSVAAHKVKEGVSSITTEHRQIIETIKSLVLAKCKSKKKFQKIFSMVDRDSSGTLNVQEFFVLIQQCVKGHDNVAKKLTKQIFDIMWDDFCDNEGGVDCKAASEWIFS